jgi:hypothetical protein
VGLKMRLSDGSIYLSPARCLIPLSLSDKSLQFIRVSLTHQGLFAPTFATFGDNTAFSRHSNPWTAWDPNL